MRTLNPSDDPAERPVLQRVESEVCTKAQEPEGPQETPTVKRPHAEDPCSVLGDTERTDVLGQRYAVSQLLGAGGMGEVYLCKDLWIGREIALKVLRPELDTQEGEYCSRFVSEARIQAQLEHPNIVPVYELGGESTSRAPIPSSEYFTMKRILGVSLASVIASLRAEHPQSLAEYSRHRLLASFSQVCLAVAYAHSRGVIHRDIKPANILLGTFGEVYLIDWGVAKVLDESELDSRSWRTKREWSETEGEIVGTLGYLAPEQLQGEPATERSDVYALGAVLFELLTLERLNSERVWPGTGEEMPVEIVQAPSLRAPLRDIPPELDTICMRATETNGQSRFSSARAMYEQITNFLSGERDEATRMSLAQAHLNAARRALEHASMTVDNAQARRDGMRELGRAVALDPSNEAALGMIAQLVLGDATALPPEVETDLDKAAIHETLDLVKRVARLRFAWLSLIPFCLLLGVRAWGPCLGFASCLAGVGVLAHYIRNTKRASPQFRAKSLLILFAAAFLGIVGFGSAFVSPFLMTPSIATALAAVFSVGAKRRRPSVLAIATGTALAILIPAALQFAEVIPKTFVVEDNTIKFLPALVDYPPLPTYAFLIFATVAQISATIWFVAAAADSLWAMERRSFAQAWRLRQLLPHEVQPTKPGGT